MNDVGRRLRDVERRALKLPPGADPLQTFEDGSPLGDTRFLDFGAGVNARLIGDDYVLVEGAGAGTRWGTVVVAAADTHQLGRDQADFVCTGSADQSTLDLALDAAPEGGEIVLLEGTYNLTAAWNIDESGTHVRGMGMKTILSYSTGVSGNVITVSALDVRVSNLYIVKAGGTPDSAVTVASDAADDFQMRGVFVDGTFPLGAALRGTRWKVESCRFNGCTISIRGFSGEAARGVIQGNVVIGGVTGVTNDSGCTDISIIGNQCQGQSSGAIVANGDRTTVIGNVANGSASNPLGGSGADCVYADNIVNGGGSGACIRSDGLRAILTGNRVQGGTGIGIDLANNTQVCTGNLVRSSGTIGIRVLGRAQTVITGNTVTLAGQEGILITTIASDCSVQGNLIFQCGQTTDNTYDGIRISNSDRNDVQGNTIRQGPGANDHRYGINIEAGSDDNLICNNDLFDSAQTASFIDGGTNTRSCTSGGPPGGGSAVAPVSADYLVGTANADLTSEIVVGPTPGGELGGTWASPTVDTTHSGSPHGVAIEDEGAAEGQALTVDFAGDGVSVGFAGTEATVTIPGVGTPTAGWGSITNATTDRAYDADATTIDELADTLATLVADLIAQGIIAT